jgi:hypothetical protein
LGNHRLSMHEDNASGGNSAVECQLPKLDVAGSIPVPRSIFSTTSGSCSRAYSNVLQLHDAEGRFQRVQCVLANAQPSLAANVQVHVNGMPELVGHGLRIDLKLAHEG